MIGINPTITLPLTAAITAGHGRAEFKAAPATEPHIGPAVDYG
jgi:hypothetical protein